MAGKKIDDLTIAKNKWSTGDPLESGRIVFQMVSVNTRVAWAARILRVAMNNSQIRCAEIEDILRFAEHRDEWKLAHAAFSALRQRTLELEDSPNKSREDIVLLYHLYLAENVAKVVYNASEPVDRFDDDSGWWVLVCLKDLVDLWKDDDFAKIAWDNVCTF